MRPRHIGSALLALALLAGGGSALAATLDARSMTLVQGRAEPADGEVRTVVPIIEIVTLNASEIANPVAEDLAFTFEGWGRLNLAEEKSRIDDAADLNLAYLSGRLLDKKLGLKVGRHMVFGGAARSTQIDGASADVRIWKGIGASAYGGLPVIPRFAVANGDAVAGGRVFYRYSPDAEIGASFIQVWDDGDTGRQDAGVDFRYLPIRTVTIGGLGMWSIYENRLSEADLRVDWQPRETWQIWGNVRRTAPDLFLSRTSIFSVFTDEKRDEAGGGIYVRPIQPLRAWASYNYLRFFTKDIGGSENGHQAVLRGSWDFGKFTTVGVQGRLLRAPVNGYFEERVFAVQRFTDALYATVDLDAYQFENSINGEKQSYVASASAVYNVTPEWMAAVTGLASVTPFFDNRFEVLAKLVYNFSTHQREVTP